MAIIRRIMVVDDSPMVHKLMGRFLEDFDVCAYGNNGQEGIDFFKKYKPDLTFLDITMPIVDGIGALRGIKAIDAGAKVVMLSAMADEEIMAEARKLGVLAFLQKPFNKETLTNLINEIRKLES